ncbi:MAG TPA: lysophospholipid acyltransferase family protein [Chitinophaga sp.]
MRFLSKAIRWVYVIWAAFWFVGIMLLILPFIILSSFLGRITGGNIIYYFLWFWSRTWFPLVGMFVQKIYVGEHHDKAAMMYAVNHTSYLDAALAVGQIRLPFRPLGKVEMQKIPVFGFIYKHAVVTVDRSSARDRVLSVRKMMDTLRQGVSILIFPEGSTNTTGQPLTPFHNGAFKIAIETQTNIKPVLFLDNVDRLPEGKGPLALNPGRVRIVYLPVISVQGLTVADQHTLKQQVYNAMEAALRQYRTYPEIPIQA